VALAHRAQSSIEVCTEGRVHLFYRLLVTSSAGHLTYVGVDVVLAVLQSDSAGDGFEPLRLQDIIPVLGHCRLHQGEVHVEALYGKVCGISHFALDLFLGKVDTVVVGLCVLLEHVPQEPGVLCSGPLVLQPSAEYSGVAVGSSFLNLFDAFHSLEGGDDMASPESSLLDVIVGNIVEEDELLISEAGEVLAQVVAERRGHRGEELRDCGYENPKVDRALAHEVFEEVLDLYQYLGSHE
jgi:hypothetical protein